jgi:microcin C transport system substrate-binding protein
LAFLIGFNVYGTSNLSLGIGATPKYSPCFSHFQYTNPQAPKGGSIRLKGYVFQSLNPFEGQSKAAPGLERVFATLMMSPLDDPTSQYGYLAESVEISGKKVTFSLRKNATFHNGNLIGAKDVVFSFQYLIKLANAPYRFQFQDVLKVEQEGDLKVHFYFKNAASVSVAFNLGTLPIFSQAHVNKKTGEAFEFIGSGPYKIKKTIGKHSILYERISNWWGENLPVAKGLYNFDEILYVGYENSTVAFEGFKKGEYDFQVENKILRWKTGYTFPAVIEGKVLLKEFHPKIYRGLNALFFNLRQPRFQERDIRKAITLMMDFQWMNQHLFFNAYDRTQSVFRNTPYAHSSLLTDQERKLINNGVLSLPNNFLEKEIYYENPNRSRIQEALMLFKKHGWEIKKGKLIHAKTSIPFKLKILFVNPENTRALQEFIRSLRKIGIEGSLERMDQTQYIYKLNHFDFDLVLYHQNAVLVPGPEQKAWWGSSVAQSPGTMNIAGVSSPMVDELIEAMIKASYPEEHQALAKTLDRVLFHEHYFIPLWFPEKIFIAFWDKFLYPSKDESGLNIDMWWSKV